MERLLLIIAFNLAYYFQTLRFGYISDDLQTADYNFKGGFFKKLYNNLRDRKWNDPPAEHLTSVIVHTFNCSLIYWVFGKNDVSFYAALLFSVNPVVLFSVAWLSGRGYAMCCLSALLFYWLKAKGVIFYILGVLYGIPTFALPLFFIKQYPVIMTLAMICFLIGVKKMHPPKAIQFRMNIMNKEHKKILSINKVIIAFKTYAYYITHCIFPRRLGMYHTFLFTYGLQEDDVKRWTKLDYWFWGGIALAGFTVYIIISDFYGLRMPMLWFLFTVMLWMNLFMMNQTIADRYAYTPCVGMMLILAKVLPFEFMLMLLTYYFTRNYLFIRAFKNDDIFLEYNLYDMNFPDQTFAWQLKGEKERLLLRPFQALESWSKGLKYRPQDNRLHFFIAKTLAEMGFFKEAEMHLDEMEKHPMNDIKNGVTSAILPLRKIIAKKRAEKNIHK